MTSLVKLAEEARSFLEGHGRVNARTTVLTAASAAAKEAATLKTASKAFATALSQLPTILKAAHEFSDDELKAAKKLLDRAQTTQEKLKKYVKWAEENATAASELAKALARPGPSGRIPPEPDPDKPFRR